MNSLENLAIINKQSQKDVYTRFDPIYKVQLNHARAWPTCTLSRPLIDSSALRACPQSNQFTWNLSYCQSFHINAKICNFIYQCTHIYFFHFRMVILYTIVPLNTRYSLKFSIKRVISILYFNIYFKPYIWKFNILYLCIGS